MVKNENKILQEQIEKLKLQNKSTHNFYQNTQELNMRAVSPNNQTNPSFYSNRVILTRMKLIISILKETILLCKKLIINKTVV